MGIHSNSARYAERTEHVDMLRATQEELASKIKELQIYESNYVTLKKDLTRWKQKFEYVFHENELLALETGKLDASHKQIAFLQSEMKFKDQESTALRGLLSALEAATKKEREKQMEAIKLRETELEVVAALSAEQKSSETGDELLQSQSNIRREENERLSAEIAALKTENTLLLKDVDRKDEELQRQDEQILVHKTHIDGLQHALKEEQEAGMTRLKEKQDKIQELEKLVQQMQMRRRSSVVAALAEAEEEGRDTIGFGPVDRLKSSQGKGENDDSEDEPDTPPGTPPPISSGGLLPLEDPTADQTIRDWTEDRKISFVRSFEEALDLDRLEEFIRKLPYEHQEGASRVLMGALDPDTMDEPVNESQIVLRHLSSERQTELREFLLPLLKSHPALRVSYSTMERRTLVTDVRIQIERRRNSVLNGFVAGEKRFGKDHLFLGPSIEDVGKLVPHVPRAISTGSKAVYVSKPKVAESLANIAATSPQERASEHTEDMDTCSESAEPPPPEAMTSKRKWGGLNAAKFINTMAAGAKQRVAATFKNSKFAHEGTSCQFCKMTPIVGERYSCATCVGFDLCENCYSLGGHGMENSDELFYRVQELVLARCPRLAEEVDLLELMRFEICRSNLRKFSFCLNWLADIVNGKSSKDLQARALEIPRIRRDVRKVFVPLLMRVCSDRDDIEVKTEWELEDDNQAPVRSVSGGVSEGDGRFLEALRIWVADQYRTTSPFVERSLLKYHEDDEESEEDEDASDTGTGCEGGQSDENESQDYSCDGDASSSAEE